MAEDGGERESWGGASDKAPTFIGSPVLASALGVPSSI